MSDDNNWWNDWWSGNAGKHYDSDQVLSVEILCNCDVTMISS